MKIERVCAKSLDTLLSLVAEYQRSYNKEPDFALNRAYFGQLLETQDHGVQFIVRGEEQQALAFATLYFVPNFITVGNYCSLADLYVTPTVRGLGIDNALLQHCIDYAQQLGYDYVRVANRVHGEAQHATKRGLETSLLWGRNKPTTILKALGLGFEALSL
jgi:ribosomal protein S18 acetylase RimI-like enzyme